MNKKLCPPILKKWLLLTAPVFTVLLFVSASGSSMLTSERCNTVSNSTAAADIMTYSPSLADNYILITPPDYLNDFTLCLVNDKGDKVKEVDLNISSYIKISDLPSGQYFIKCASHDEIVGKVILR